MIVSGALCTVGKHPTNLYYQPPKRIFKINVRFFSSPLLVSVKPEPRLS